MKALVHDGHGSIALLDRPRPRLLEVFTDKDEDIRQLKAYYHSLKNKSITF